MSDSRARSARSQPLIDALGQVAAFPPGRAGVLLVDPDLLAKAAAEEARSGHVSLDARALTAGERLAVLQPARQLVADWRATRSAFDVAIEPSMADLEAASALETETASLEARAHEELAVIARRAETNHAWRETSDRYAEARARFEASRLAHGNRDANMRAHHPLYWFALLLVGAAEWLINYDTLVMFFGIPAMAIGATAILAIAMAFASHAHGIVWKQWSHRFGRHRDAGQQASSQRLIGIGTLSLLFVLLFAGFARFSVVIHQVSAQPAENILGAQANISFDPSRDVLISLLANLLAWLVGCFLSYFCHDEDPAHMAATAQFGVWQRRFLRVDRPFRQDREVLTARTERELAERRTAAEARRARVRPQSEMLAQVDAHELAVMRAIQSAVLRNLSTYRAALADEVARTAATVTIEDGRNDDGVGAPTTIDARTLRTLPHRVDIAYVEQLA